MSLINEIQSKANAILKGQYSIIETSDLSKLDSITDNSSAIVTSATVFFINLKNIPYIVKNDGKRNAAKTYTTYFEIVNCFANETGGYLTKYDSKSFLLIYPSGSNDIDKHIENAYKLSFILGKFLPKKIEQFNSISFSIGIDHGRILGVKIGDEKIWLGTCINKAAAISELCIKPSYLGISGFIYSELGDEMKTYTRHILGIPKKENTWLRGSYQFENEHKHFYTSHYTIEVK